MGVVPIASQYLEEALAASSISALLLILLLLLPLPLVLRTAQPSLGIARNVRALLGLQEEAKVRREGRHARVAIAAIASISATTAARRRRRRDDGVV